MPTQKDATQNPGVSEEKDQVSADTQDTDQDIDTGEEIEPEPYHGTRLSDIEKIAASNDRARAEEFKDGLDVEPDDDTGDDEEDETDDEDIEDDEVDDDEDPDKDDQPTEKMVEIIVDGQKRTVPESKVKDFGIRALQKELTADKRLEEATRLLRDAQATIAQQKPGQPSEPQDDGQTDDPDTGDLEKRAQELSAAIQYGSQEEAAKAVTELIGMGRSQNKAATPEQIAGTVFQVLNSIETKKQQEEDTKVLEKFKSPRKDGGFNDIANDPVKMAAASALVEKKRAAGDNRNDWEFYQEVGTETRSLFGGVKTSKSTKDRLERKKKIVNVKSAGARVPSAATDTPQTEEDMRRNALSDIKKARGQTD